MSALISVGRVTRFYLTLLVLASLVLLSVGTARGQFNRFGGGVNNGDLANADSGVAKAEGDATMALDALTALTAQMKQAFEGSPEYVKAKADADAAAADYDAARSAAVDKLRDSAAYKSAVADRDAAAAALADGQANGLTGSDIVPLARASMQAKSALAKLEAAGLAKDADYLAAKSKMVGTAKAAKDLQDAFALKLAADPAVAADRAAVRQTRANLAAAQGMQLAAQNAINQEQTDANNARAAELARERAANGGR